MPRVSARKEIVKAIAEALNVSPTWLLTGEGARDSAEASLPPTDPKAEPQMFGAEVFDRLYEMAQEALDGYGPHSVPLEARRVILPLVSRIYAEQGPAPFLPPERWVTYEWKGWETQQKEFGSSDPGVTPQDIRYLLEHHLGLAPVLGAAHLRLNYGERVSSWLSALARVYTLQFGGTRHPHTRREFVYTKAAWEYEQEELRSGGDPPPCPRCGRRGFYAPRFAEPDRRYRACKFCGLWQNVGKPPHEIIRYECHQHPDGSEVADWKEPHESWDCPSCGRHFTPGVGAMALRAT